MIEARVISTPDARAATAPDLLLLSFDRSPSPSCSESSGPPAISSCKRT